VSPGSSITVTTVQTPDGDPTQSSPASGATVAYIFLSQGAVVYSNSTTTGSNGQATLNVPSTMEPGSYILNILASSSTAKLVKPLVTSIVIGPAAVTSSSVSQSSSTSTTSTTSSSGTNYTYYVAAAVVVVILIAVATTFMRRRK
jgi:hypothetical protein